MCREPGQAGMLGGWQKTEKVREPVENRYRDHQERGKHERLWLRGLREPKRPRDGRKTRRQGQERWGTGRGGQTRENSSRRARNSEKPKREQRFSG